MRIGYETISYMTQNMLCYTIPGKKTACIAAVWYVAAMRGWLAQRGGFMMHNHDCDVDRLRACGPDATLSPTTRDHEASKHLPDDMI